MSRYYFKMILQKNNLTNVIFKNLKLYFLTYKNLKVLNKYILSLFVFLVPEVSHLCIHIITLTFAILYMILDSYQQSLNLRTLINLKSNVKENYTYEHRKTISTSYLIK